MAERRQQLACARMVYLASCEVAEVERTGAMNGFQEKPVNRQSTLAYTGSGMRLQSHRMLSR